MPDASEYLLYRAMQFQGPYSLRATVAAPATEYYDELGGSGLEFWYYVMARFPDTSVSYESYRDSGYSGISNPWTPVSVAATDGAAEIAVFESVSPDGVFTQVSEWLPASELLFDRMGGEEIKESQVYHYRLRARNVYGASGWSTTDPGWIGETPPRVAMPVLSPPAGLFLDPLDVAVTCATAGAALHYTTEDRTPELADPVVASGGTIRIEVPTQLRVRAWRDGWQPSEEAGGLYACTAGDGLLIVTGDVDGAIRVITAPGGREIVRRIVFTTPVASVRVLDADGDGVQDILALPLMGRDEPAVCLDLLLNEKWRSKDPCGLVALGRSQTGRVAQAADVNGEGPPEVILPAETAGGSVEVRIADGRTGAALDPLPELWAACPVLYFDAGSGHYRFAGARKDGDIAWLASFDLEMGSWNWTDEAHPVWRAGAISRVLFPGDPPVAMLWGGGSDEFSAYDGAGGKRWNLGGLAPPRLDAGGVFVPDLDGLDTPALAIECETGAEVSIDAVKLKDGTVAWSWKDPVAYGFAQVLGVGTLSGVPGALLVVRIGGDEGLQLRPQLHGVRGSDGATLWSVPYDYRDMWALEARVIDVDAPAKPRVVVVVNHRIEILDARFGTLEFRLEGPANITTFDIAAGFTDRDDDGAQGWAEAVAGTNPDDKADVLRIVACDWIEGRPCIAWSSVAGRWYEVLWTDDLRAPFRRLTNNIPAHPARNEEELPPPAGRQVFYRVQVHE